MLEDWLRWLEQEKSRPTACTVKEAVSRLDGVVDCIGTGVIVDFPQPGQR